MAKSVDKAKTITAFKAVVNGLAPVGFHCLLDLARLRRSERDIAGCLKSYSYMK